MAAALGVHRTTVSRWELGKIHTMSCDHLSGWARVTGVPYNWLLHNEGLPGGKLAALVGEGRRWVKPHIKPLPSSLGIVSDWWQYKEREKARAAGSDEWDRAGSAPVKSDRF